MGQVSRDVLVEDVKLHINSNGHMSNIKFEGGNLDM